MPALTRPAYTERNVASYDANSARSVPQGNRRTFSRLIWLDSFEPDTTRYPIPPTHVERSATECVHTPQPDGYGEWHEWARMAAKTHSQVRCPHCGCWKIWLPKAEAVKVRKQDSRKARAFSAAYQKDFDARKKARRA